MATHTAHRDRRTDPGRHANLSAVVRRVHAALRSRSELTRLTGLNRSTIAALVAELADCGLVVPPLGRRREFDRHLLAPLVSDVEFRRAELGADVLLIGAASIPLED